MSNTESGDGKGIKIVVFESEIEKQAGKIAGKVFGTAADGLTGITGDIIGGLVTDRIKEWRTRNLVHSLSKTADLLKAKGIPLDKVKALPMGEAYAMFEEASKQDDPTIQDMWAALLANAMDPHSEVHIEPAVVATLRNISGAEARLLEFIYEYRAVCMQGYEELNGSLSGPYDKETYGTLYAKVTQRTTTARTSLTKRYLPNASTAVASKSLHILVKEACICIPAPEFSGQPILKAEEPRRDISRENDAALRDALNDLAASINEHSGFIGGLPTLLDEKSTLKQPNYDLTTYGEHLLLVCGVRH